MTAFRETEHATGSAADRRCLFMQLARICCVPVVLAAVCPMARTDEQPSPASLIKRSVSALGGQERILLLARSYVRTKATVGSAFGEVEDWVDGKRSKRIAIFHNNGMTARFVSVVTGDVRWHKINDEEWTSQKVDNTTVKPDSQIRALARSLFPLVDSKEEYRLEFRGNTKIGDSSAHHVQIKNKELPDLDLFLDATTALLVKYNYHAKDGRFAGKHLEEVLSAYQDFDGLKYATKGRITVDGTLFSEDEVMELRLMKEFPKGTFDRPK